MTQAPTFVQLAQSPDALLLDNEGIVVGVPEPYRRGARSLMVHGVFRLAKVDAALVDQHCLHGVVIVVRSPVGHIVQPAADALLFDDDLLDEGDTVRGYFNVDLGAGIQRVQSSRIWVSASILHHVSPVVAVSCP